MIILCKVPVDNKAFALLAGKIAKDVCRVQLQSRVDTLSDEHQRGVSITISRRNHVAEITVGWEHIGVVGEYMIDDCGVID